MLRVSRQWQHEGGDRGRLPWQVSLRERWRSIGSVDCTLFAVRLDLVIPKVSFDVIPPMDEEIHRGRSQSVSVVGFWHMMKGALSPRLELDLH